jgi:hypothetical protein
LPASVDGGHVDSALCAINVRREMKGLRMRRSAPEVYNALATWKRKKNRRKILPIIFKALIFEQLYRTAYYPCLYVWLYRGVHPLHGLSRFVIQSFGCLTN